MRGPPLGKVGGVGKGRSGRLEKVRAGAAKGPDCEKIPTNGQESGRGYLYPSYPFNMIMP